MILLILSWTLALLGLAQAIAALRGMPRLPDLTRAEPPVPISAAGPDLSVIVPACNQEAAIAATLRSLLASTGLRLHILAVDDRSTDHTGVLMDEVAAEAASTPHTFQVIHIATLPAGWLGKPHALAMAAAQARAPWLLFTDGDVFFAPDALARTLAYASSEQADHVVLVPTLIVRSWAERAIQAAMQILAQWTIHLWKVADPSTRDFIGVGGFNLIRREAYQSVGGYEAMPFEVLDDLRMGWKLKRSGFCQRVVLGPGLVHIRWIVGALSVISLVEKNGFSLYRFRTPLHLLATLGLALQAVIPIAALFGGLWTISASVVFLLALVLNYQAHRRLTLTPAWYALFYCPCVAIVGYAFLRSMVLALVRGGIRWRGTFYDLATLRRNAGRW